MPSKTTVYAGCMTKAVAVACAMFSTPSVMAHASNSVHDHGYVEIAQSGGIFSDEERRIIRDVLDVATGTVDADQGRGNDKGGKGNGNKGKGNKGLPPGIAMKLERGGSLPPGIAKRDLPADLRARLPNRTDDAIRQIVGNDVVLIQKGTELILDVISDVVRN